MLHICNILNSTQLNRELRTQVSDTTISLYDNMGLNRVKICNGLSRLKLNELFTLADNTRGIRGHSWKLVKFRCTRDCCKYFFFK